MLTNLDPAGRESGNKQQQQWRRRGRECPPASRAGGGGAHCCNGDLYMVGSRPSMSAHTHGLAMTICYLLQSVPAALGALGPRRSVPAPPRVQDARAASVAARSWTLDQSYEHNCNLLRAIQQPPVTTATMVRLGVVLSAALLLEAVALMAPGAHGGQRQTLRVGQAAHDLPIQQAGPHPSLPSLRLLQASGR